MVKAAECVACEAAEERPATIQVAAPSARVRLVTPSFLVVAIATLAYFLADGVLIPAVPRYVEGPLGGGSVAVGLVVGAFSFSALALRPLGGRLGDRRGRRLVMVVGAGIFAASVLGYVVASSVTTMVLMRLLTGAGEALFFVGAAAAIADMAPEERRGEAVSFFSLALYAGIGFGPFLGEAAIDRSGFTAAWLVGAGAALLAVLLALGVPETRATTGERGRMGRFLHPAGILPGAVLLSSVWGVAGFLAFVPLYTIRLGIGGSRLVFVLFSAIVMAVRLFGAKIPDRVGGRRAASAALTLQGTGLLVAGLWQTAAGLYLGTVIFSLGVSLAFPALMLLAVRGAPASERGAVLGTFTAFIDLAFGIGPVTLGFVAGAVGLAGSFLAAAVVAALGLVLLAASSVGRRPTGEPA
jgi:MFS family permease